MTLLRRLPLVCLLTLAAASTRVRGDETRPVDLVGYTAGRNDLPDGQFVNWRTNRAFVVRADGTGRREIAGELAAKENAWTQFAGWSPDGRRAIVLGLWESPENAAWERAHKTFRMTEGWLVDSCLVDLASGSITNLTTVERVSPYNTGLFFLPDGRGYGFTPLIAGVSKPYVMDLDGRNKRDVSGAGGGFAYGYSASPDGTRISYHENYQVYVANRDGGDKRRVDTGRPFNFAPQWSPDGEWLLFLAGEHYDCHPHVARRDGSALRKLADRGGYRGVVERLKHPDFHSESSDVPVWARDGRSIYYTARIDDRVELMRAWLDGRVERLTRSGAGVRHYHPSPSPDGRWILFGSDRDGVMQLYVARADGTEARAVTDVPAGSCAMHGHWQPASRFAIDARADRLTVSLGERRVAEYVFGDPQILRPYFAHVTTPGGVQVTRRHPPVAGQDATDHDTMHPGAWLGLGDVNGQDFWRNKGRIEHVRFVEAPRAEGDAARWVAESRLLAADGAELGRMTNRFVLRASDTELALSWDAVFRSETHDLTFGDQEEMGLGVRVATPLAEKNGGALMIATGEKTAAATWGRTAAWCDYSGRIDGRPVGVTIVPRADNFRPCWWHNRDYGVFVANPFGRAAFRQGDKSSVVVRKGEEFRLGFTVIAHEGADYAPAAAARRYASP